MQLDLISAFIIGLLGAGHCIGMCGGITTMLTTAIGPNNVKKTQFIFLYNLGRILSYSVLGAIAGFTGSLAIKQIGLPIITLKVLAGIFLILLGLYIGRWALLLNYVEATGKTLWKKIQPLSKKLIPVNSARKALGLGVLWGWLPCGLIYSTLTWSIASGSAQQGFLIMFAFGLGTLPALLTVSLGATQLKQVLNLNWVRKAIGLALIIYGIITLKFAYQLLI